MLQSSEISIFTQLKNIQQMTSKISSPLGKILEKSIFWISFYWLPKKTTGKTTKYSTWLKISKNEKIVQNWNLKSITKRSEIFDVLDKIGRLK